MKFDKTGNKHKTLELIFTLSQILDAKNMEKSIKQILTTLIALMVHNAPLSQLQSEWKFSVDTDKSPSTS